MAEQSTCHTCVYAHWDAGLWMRTLWSGFAAGPTCGNQPDSYGRLKECPRGGARRNYRVRPPVPQGDAVKTIPLGDGVYAYVDAADYEWLNQWQWRVHGGYPARHEKHRVVDLFGEFARLNFPEKWPAERRREVHARWLREQVEQEAKAGRRGPSIDYG